jgi:hypothetical protein
MDDAKKRSWDILLGIIVPLVTVGGILVGVWQFNTGERNRTTLEYELIKQKDLTDFKRKLWLERLSSYKSIAGIAGQIAAYPRPDKKFDQLVQSFDSSYWGSMVLLEDDNVEKEMIKFHLAIGDYVHTRITSEKLKQHADILVQTCKKSIETGSIQ